MRVWENRCEIWNEGSLPEGLTPEMLLEPHSSHPRNKNIAYAFFKAGFIYVLLQTAQIMNDIDTIINQ